MKSFILDRHLYLVINMCRACIHMADCKDVNYSQEWLNSQNRLIGSSGLQKCMG